MMTRMMGKLGSLAGPIWTWSSVPFHSRSSQALSSSCVYEYLDLSSFLLLFSTLDDMIYSSSAVGASFNTLVCKRLATLRPVAQY
jgi:hypothetical protein